MGERPGQMTPRGKTRALQKAFLAKLGEVYGTTVAAEAVGINRNSVYNWCRRYPAFREAFEDAKEAVLDKIEASFAQAATETHEGNKMGFLAGIALLKSPRPEYRDRVDINQTITSETRHLHVIASMSDQEVEAGLRRHLGRLSAEGKQLPQARAKEPWCDLESHRCIHRHNGLEQT